MKTLSANCLKDLEIVILINFIILHYYFINIDIITIVI